MELATSTQSSRRIHLDSEYANMSGNIYTFDISNNSINATTGNNILIQLLDGVFPHSFYPIDGSNNMLSWNYNDISQNDIIVTPGHYSASELCTELLNDMSGGRPDLKVTFNPKNNKVTFSDSKDITFNSSGTILETLGFDISGNISGTDLSGTNQINLSGPDSFYLHIDNLDLPNIDPSGNTDNLLARIPIISSFNGYTFYYNERNSPNIISDQSISKFEIRLEDKSGKHINFNGLHWSITLGVMFATSKGSGARFYDTLQF
tara:strand:+ start:1118 stop:1906 length:789 start_codon:yes stop_codon:yes gene_type:complete